MRIRRVRIENFGCIKRAEIDFSESTALIGQNNSGKSTILRAIDVFFTPAPKIERRHYYKHQQDKVISIEITFNSITPAERLEFGSAVVEGELTVLRSFGGENDGLYSVEALLNPSFAEFRNEKNGTKQRSIYTSLRSEFGLPTAANVAEMGSNLAEWEKQNPDQLERVKQRGFFGAPNVAAGVLRKKTSVRFIPAVVDVADEVAGVKTSPVISILNDVRRQSLENKPEFKVLVENLNKSVTEFVEGVEDSRVAEMSGQMTAILSRYYADSEVSAELPPHNELSVSFPPPNLKIKHRAIADGVENVGHGLQRAVLFAVVQFLAEHFVQIGDESRKETFSEAASDIIVLVEEPEIYQHPLKQRIIRDVLSSICVAFDKATGIRFQVIICTHSEKFVRISEIDSIRVVNTSFVEDDYVTNIAKTSLSEMRDVLHLARGGAGQPMGIGTFGAGMHVFSEAVSEGFFAEKVVLVEGVGDAAALSGAYMVRGRDPQSEGIAILPVDGKTKLDRPVVGYTKLGIKTYCVFDNDRYGKDKRTSYNVLLQNLFGVADPVEFPMGVFQKFAAIDGNLEASLSRAAGDAYADIQSKVAKNFGISPGDMAKSPATVSAFILAASAKGVVFDELDRIVDAIDAL